MPKLFLLGLLVILSFLSSVSSALSENEKLNVKATPENLKRVPKDAAQLITSLPGQRIKMDLILKRAIEVTDQIKLVQASQVESLAAEWEAFGVVGWTLETSLGVSDDRSEPRNALSTNRVETNQISTSLSKYWCTGTRVELSLEHTEGNIQFGAFPSSEFVDTKGTISITQDLLKDFGGRSTRRILKSGELAKQNLEIEFLEGAEDMVDQLNELYYQAWVSQSRLVAANNSVRANIKLLNITERKRKRGTSEEPDVLQIQSALLRARTEVSQSRQDLANIWRALSTSLKFPESWLDIDPALIPLELDEPVDHSVGLCGRGEVLNKPKNLNTGIRKAEINLKNSKLQLERAGYGKNPDVFLQFTGTSNGVEDTRSESFSEFTEGKTPGLTVGVSVRWNIDSFQERAALQRAKANHQRATAIFDQAKSNLQIDWINACKDLKRRMGQISNWKKAAQKQRRRYRLEEKRFSIGRIPVLNVIQAQNDSIQAEFSYRNELAQLRRSAWVVKKLAGETEAYVQETLRELGDQSE